jgi:hypothetical protein
MPPRRLRDFIYVDDQLVESFLSQVEGGLSDEEIQTASSGRDAKGGLALGAGPAKLSAAAGRDAHESSERTVRQTSDSRCARLIDQLEATDAAQYLEALDDAIWAQLRRSEALQIEAEGAVPTIVRFAETARSVNGLADVMEAFGSGVLDDEARAAMEGIASFVGLMQTVPLIARPIGATDYAFIAPLKRDGLRGSLDQLAGEMSVLATLQRKLRPDEQWSIFNEMGLAGLPESARQDMTEAFAQADETFSDAVISSPAALVTTVAVWR